MYAEVKMKSYPTEMSMNIAWIRGLVQISSLMSLSL